MSVSMMKISDLKNRGWWKFFQRHSHGFAIVTTLTVMVIVWLIWGLGGGQFIADYLCRDDAECKRVQTLGAIGDIFGGINALFAGLALGAVAFSTDLTRRAFSEDRLKTQDEIYVKQVQLTYEWAFEVFTQKDTQIPDSSRLLWLTTARHLIRAQQISEMVKSEVFRLILEEHTEYWRRRFFDVLEQVRKERHGDLATTYFGSLDRLPLGPGEDGTKYLHPIIHLGSAEVIIAFSQWNDAREDPIDWAAKNGNYEKAYEAGIGKSLLNYKTRLEKQRLDLAARRAEIPE